MDTITELAINFWQITLVGVLIIIGFVVNLFNEKDPKLRVGFFYEELPHMQPIPIPTKEKGFFGAVGMWLFGTRKWKISKDFEYTLTGEQYIIPKGFEFDGASVPKFLHMWLSPVGVLLMGGLIHDYGYKYKTLIKKKRSMGMGPWSTCGEKDQKWMDETFRDINIEINGFRLLNYLAYWSLRLGGFVAWNGHRKVDSKVN
jgi:hypothetical protein